MKNSIPEIQEPILERATFEFSQEANGLSHPDASEFLTIECVISRHCQTMSERQAVLERLASEKSELTK